VCLYLRLTRECPTQIQFRKPGILWCLSSYARFFIRKPFHVTGAARGRLSIGGSDSRLGSQTRGHNSGGGDQWWRPGAVRTARGGDSGAIATSGGGLTPLVTAAAEV
jgi:hypothetical protein